jgi:hypothetical protein
MEEPQGKLNGAARRVAIGIEHFMAAMISGFAASQLAIS